MLPDLRLLAIATLSTFVATVGAALFVSSRLLPEPAAFHTDRNAEEAPIGRISGAWPDARQFGPRDLNISPRPQAPAAPTPKLADRPSTDSPPIFEPSPAPSAASPDPAQGAAGTSTAVESLPASTNPPAPAAPTESVAVKDGAAPSQPAAGGPQENPAAPGTASETTPPDQTGSIPEKPQNSTPPAARPNDAPKSASLPPEKPKVEKRKPAPRVVKRRRLIPAPAATANGSATTSTAPARDFFVDFPSSPR